MSELELPEITDLERVIVQPGDTLVVTFPQRISQQAAAVVNARLIAKFPDQRIIVLDGGATFQVVGQEDT